MRRLFVIASLAVFILAFAIKVAVKSEKINVVSIADIHKTDGTPVDVFRISAGSIERWRSFSGTFEGIKQGMLFADTSLPVVAVDKKIGDRVIEGDVVIRLDSKIKTMMVGSYEMARLQYEQAQREVDRVKALYAEGGVTQSMMEQAEMGLSLAKINMTNTRAVVNLASPITGVITNLAVNVGMMAHPGMPLATVADMSKMKATVTVSESDLVRIKLGQSMRVFCSAGNCIKGTVSRRPLSAEPMTRLFTVEGIFENQNGAILPGTLHEVEILTDLRESGFLAPTDAIVEEGYKKFVFIASSENNGLIARKKEVEVGINLRRDTEITSGVVEGDVVIVTGINMIADGTKIKIHSELNEKTPAETPPAKKPESEDAKE